MGWLPKVRYPSILLASGGIDSFVAYHYLAKPQTLYFDIGGRYSAKEKAVVKELFPGIIVDTSLYLGDVEADNANVPFRNLFFFAMAAARYSDRVHIVGLKDDKVSDKNEAVFKEFSDLLSKLSGTNVVVSSPFWGHTKADVVRWYLEAGLDKEVLLSTVSCYSGGTERYCGECACCFRKWAALWAAGIQLPYHNQETLQLYKQRCEAGEYDQGRCEYTLRAIKEYEEHSNRH